MEYNSVHRAKITPREMLIVLLENRRDGELAQLVCLPADISNLCDAASQLHLGHSKREEGEYHDG